VTDPHNSIILHFVSRIFMIPFMIMFALYVLVHGEAGPGGGFQAGAVLAAAVILSRLSLGRKQCIVTTKGLVVIAVLGLMLYSLTGLLPMFFGGEYLNYGLLPVPNQAGIVFGHVTTRSVGILLIEVGVTMGVMGVLGAMFDYLSGSEWGSSDVG
jgi:multicomponent Na+:H+ antiporter subunit B